MDDSTELDWVSKRYFYHLLSIVSLWFWPLNQGHGRTSLQGTLDSASRVRFSDQHHSKVETVKTCQDILPKAVLNPTGATTLAQLAQNINIHHATSVAPPFPSTVSILAPQGFIWKEFPPPIFRCLKKHLATSITMPYNGRTTGQDRTSIA
jgi:hypothetical protein